MGARVAVWLMGGMERGRTRRRCSGEEGDAARLELGRKTTISQPGSFASHLLTLEVAMSGHVRLDFSLSIAVVETEDVQVLVSKPMVERSRARARPKGFEARP